MEVERPEPVRSIAYEQMAARPEHVEECAQGPLSEPGLGQRDVFENTVQQDEIEGPKTSDGLHHIGCAVKLHAIVQLVLLDPLPTDIDALRVGVERAHILGPHRQRRCRCSCPAAEIEDALVPLMTGIVQLTNWMES